MVRLEGGAVRERFSAATSGWLPVYLNGRTTTEKPAAPLATAVQTLERLYGVERVRVEGDEIAVQMSPDIAPVMARELIAAGVDLFELRADQQSLEDAFLDLTNAA